MTGTLIHGKYVVCNVIDANSAEVITDGAVYQENGMIVRVGRFDDLREEFPSAERIGSQNHVVMPGLVNAHDHVGMSRFQLGVPHRPLELSSALSLGAKDLDPYLDHLWGAAQMLESGTTTVQVMYSPGRGESPIAADLTDKVVRAYRDAGIRLAFAPILQDQNSMVSGHNGDEQTFARQLPKDLSQRFLDFMNKGYFPVDEIISLAEDVFKKYDGSENGRIKVTVAPTNVQRCSDALLMGLRALSQKYDTTLHIHLLETLYQKFFGLRAYGKTALQHLDSLKFLGPDVICGHSVWVTDEDIQLLRETRTGVCHNPSSNFRLQSGIAPVPRFLSEGIPVSIGTDDTGINDDKDMFQEMRLVLRIHRVPGFEHTPPTAHQVFAMATANGGHACGFGDSIGALEAGKKADIVLVDLKRIEEPYLDPDVSIVDAIVHRARGNDVDMVLVDGEIVVRDGKLLRLDRERLVGEIAQALDRPRHPHEIARKELGLELEPHIRRFYADAVKDLSAPHAKYNAQG